MTENESNFQGPEEPEAQVPDYEGLSPEQQEKVDLAIAQNPALERGEAIRDVLTKEKNEE